MRGHGSQWISHKINIWHLGQLKKWKSWEPFSSYQLNSTANPAQLPQNWAKYLFYVKTIESHARAFLTLNILGIGRVVWEVSVFDLLYIPVSWVLKKYVIPHISQSLHAFETKWLSVGWFFNQFIFSWSINLHSNSKSYEVVYFWKPKSMLKIHLQR